MGKRGSFTDEEWQAVQYLPLNMGMGGACTDGTVEDVERETIVTLVMDPSWSSDPFTHEVLESLGARGPGAWEASFMSSPLCGPAGAAIAVRAVDARLTPAEALSFKKTMFMLAGLVASASGSRGPVPSDSISDAEFRGLASLLDILGLTQADLDADLA